MCAWVESAGSHEPERMGFGDVDVLGFLKGELFELEDFVGGGFAG